METKKGGSHSYFLSLLVIMDFVSFGPIFLRFYHISPSPTSLPYRKVANASFPKSSFLPLSLFLNQSNNISLAHSNSPCVSLKIRQCGPFHIIFASAMWSSLPDLRTRDPLLGPPLTLEEIFRHTCLQSHLQTSPPTPQKSYPKFRNPKKTFEIFKKNFKKTKNAPQGARGGGSPTILGG